MTREPVRLTGHYFRWLCLLPVQHLKLQLPLLLVKLADLKNGTLEDYRSLSKLYIGRHNDCL